MRRLSFTGPFDLVYIANLHSRIASRILWRVAKFPYKSEDDVYNGANAVKWSHYFNADRTFKVDTNAHRSPVKSLDFITLRVKDAVADHFRGAAGRRPSVDARDPDVRIHVFLDDRMATLYVDTSGDSLFKRGKRDHVGEAPLKKNLAAGILRLAKWKPGTALLDPMCGAGTFLSEAAEISLGRAAGRERAFGFEKLVALQRDHVAAHARQREEGREAAAAPSDLRIRSLRALARPRGAQPARSRPRGRGEAEAGEPARALAARAAGDHRHQSRRTACASARRRSSRRSIRSSETR
jgi:putative N6-adenine-specific DNA methylase